MSYCTECGNELVMRQNGLEGEAPYCERCGAFRFPRYNVAVIVIVMNPAKDKVILIQQYGRTENILVAGYVNKGESLEEGLTREIKEELGLNVTVCRYMRSKYFEKSNTLMCNYIAVVDDENLDGINYEIDRLAWFTFDEARACVKPGSLAKEFLLQALKEVEDGTCAL